ncbi:hypothetical protein C9J21_18495 [Photobacterium phosphoreum]|uniref:hypothetical protein n=1 Tax=Photobacterium phosphoreum TaxID=659 RepID=UPI000D16BEFD|nr:hypothetical protein [Photobacterium phosphoreum]PSW30795.1 hypothetical protein C9J21_18495 [Photobacterium phosphoreum]
MKKLQQFLFFTSDQVAFLEWWLESSEHGLTNQQFCEALTQYGTEGSTKFIGSEGLKAASLGLKFTDILKGWLPPTALAAIYASEQVGDRQSGIKAAIIQLSGGHNVISQLVQLLWIPYLLWFVMGFLGLYVSNKILETTKDIGLGNQIFDFADTWGVIILIGLLVLFLILAFSLQNFTGKVRESLYRWPVFSLYRYSVGASLLSTLSCLISCGLSTDEALSLIKDNANPYLKSHIEKMKKQKVGKMNLGEMIDTGLFIPKQISTLKILGDNGNFALLLRKSSDAHNVFIAKRISTMEFWFPKIGLLLAIAILVTLVGSALYQLLSVTNF